MGTKKLGVKECGKTPKVPDIFADLGIPGFSIGGVTGEGKASIEIELFGKKYLVEYEVKFSPKN